MLKKIKQFVTKKQLSLSKLSKDVKRITQDVWEIMIACLKWPISFNIWFKKK